MQQKELRCGLRPGYVCLKLGGTNSAPSTVPETSRTQCFSLLSNVLVHWQRAALSPASLLVWLGSGDKTFPLLKSGFEKYRGLYSGRWSFTCLKK